MDTFRKSDVINSVIIGEMIALFLIFTSKSLEGEFPFLEIIKSKWFISVTILPAFITLFIYLTSLLGKVRPIFFEFGKFIIIGLSNTVMELGVLNLLMLLTNIEQGYYYSLFKALATIARIINGYFWNKAWTFEDTENRKAERQFLEFVTVSGFGLVSEVLIASFLVNVIGPVGGISPRLWANLGAVIAMWSTGLLTFSAFKLVVFNRSV